METDIYYPFSMLGHSTMSRYVVLKLLKTERKKTKVFNAPVATH